MKRLVTAATALLIASPALAQHEGHGAQPVAAQTAPEPQPAASPAEHDMSAMASMQHAEAPPAHDMSAMEPAEAPPAHDMRSMAPAEGPHAHDMSAMEPANGGAIGNAPAPPPPTDHAADAFFDPAIMAQSRETLRREHGAFDGSMILFDLAEYQARESGDGYRWEAEAWFGGDINRLQVKTEGEGTFGEPLESAEVQLLYSRAIAPFWNVHAGLRQDFRPEPARTYAVLGVEGIAPYWFHLSGQMFLSDQGDLRARAEGSYDQRLTQRLILAPRAEFNFSAQDMPLIGVGSGLTDLELGLRLRYEIRREFAPYVGVEWARKLGDTARYARTAGEDADATNLVAGIRFWF